MSELKCKVEKNAVPIHRLIGKSKLEALKSKFSSDGQVKTISKNLTRVEKLASVRQKESQKNAERYKSEPKGKKEGKTSKPISK